MSAPDVQQIGVKLFAREGTSVDQETFIPIFHRWIREKRLGDRLLIDVADYRHVPDGPGVMLVAHEGHYGMDEADGRLGMLYNRKRDAHGPLDEKLRAGLATVLQAARALEQEPTVAQKLAFRGDRVRVQFLSRLATPNDDETWARVGPVVEDVFTALYGAPVQLLRDPDKGRPLTIEVVGEDVALKELAEKL